MDEIRPLLAEEGMLHKFVGLAEELKKKLAAKKARDEAAAAEQHAKLDAVRGAPEKMKAMYGARGIPADHVELMAWAMEDMQTCAAYAETIEQVLDGGLDDDDGDDEEEASRLRAELNTLKPNRDRNGKKRKAVAAGGGGAGAVTPAVASSALPANSFTLPEAGAGKKRSSSDASPEGDDEERNTKRLLVSFASGSHSRAIDGEARSAGTPAPMPHAAAVHHT
jgi:hypothetical protein